MGWDTGSKSANTEKGWSAPPSGVSSHEIICVKVTRSGIMLLICLPESTLIAVSGETAFRKTVLQERSFAPSRSLMPTVERLFDIVLAIVFHFVIFGIVRSMTSS